MGKWVELRRGIYGLFTSYSLSMVRLSLLLADDIRGEGLMSR